MHAAIVFTPALLVAGLGAEVLASAPQHGGFGAASCCGHAPGEWRCGRQLQNRGQLSRPQGSLCCASTAALAHPWLQFMAPSVPSASHRLHWGMRGRGSSVGALPHPWEGPWERTSWGCSLGAGGAVGDDSAGAGGAGGTPGRGQAAAAEGRKHGAPGTGMLLRALALLPALFSAPVCSSSHRNPSAAALSLKPHCSSSQPRPSERAVLQKGPMQSTWREGCHSVSGALMHCGVFSTPFMGRALRAAWCSCVQGSPPLIHVAVQTGNVEMVRMLVAWAVRRKGGGAGLRGAARLLNTGDEVRRAQRPLPPSPLPPRGASACGAKPRTTPLSLPQALLRAHGAWVAGCTGFGRSALSCWTGCRTGGRLCMWQPRADAKSC